MAKKKKSTAAEKRYNQFVISLPCCHCGTYGVQQHHIKGIGMSGFGTRAHDIHSCPLCDSCHRLVHEDVKAYPQARWVCETQLKAMDAGLLAVL